MSVLPNCGLNPEFLLKL